jgi:uncharacterized protein YheU (UPF0270 family)
MTAERDREIRANILVSAFVIREGTNNNESAEAP